MGRQKRRLSRTQLVSRYVDREKLEKHSFRKIFKKKKNIKNEKYKNEKIKKEASKGHLPRRLKIFFDETSCSN